MKEIDVEITVTARATFKVRAKVPLFDDMDLDPEDGEAFKQYISDYEHINDLLGESDLNETCTWIEDRSCDDVLIMGVKEL